MDWDAKKKERERLIEEERQRFLTMSEAEAMTMSNSDRYQRMRYQREIEAAEWLKEVRRKLPIVQPMESKYKKRRSTGAIKYYQD
jgi:head-tail adaptor